MSTLVWQGVQGAHGNLGGETWSKSTLALRHPKHGFHMCYSETAHGRWTISGVRQGSFLNSEKSRDDSSISCQNLLLDDQGSGIF